MGSQQSSGHRESWEWPPPGWPAWLPRTLWQGSPQGGSAQIRASDAERSHAAETLSTHFAEGRLDEDELDARLQAAMSAKTRGELVPLLSDLPDLAAPGDAPRLSAWEHLRHDYLVPIAIAVSCGLFVVIGLLLLLVGNHETVGLAFLVAALYLVRRQARARRRRLHHAHLHEHGTPHWHKSNGRAVVGPGPSLRAGHPPYH
ncbi:MAG: DUF1707 SHOCT-like domain-containing protein [Acidimicrobiales bacterium]